MATDTKGMMTREMQQMLISTRRLSGRDDGIWGKLTDGGVLLAVTDGPDTPLRELDYERAAQRMQVQTAAIKAFWATEAAGAGFFQGRPKILPERHRFSKLTGGRFDRKYPSLSAPKWDKSWYPGSQDARYDVILEWGRLLSEHDMPIDAAFAAVSWGAPQIMGENAVWCGYRSPFEFAVEMSRDEPAQLLAFERFITRKKLLNALRTVGRTEKSWDPVSAGYNGTAFRQNGYSTKMLANFIKFGGK